MLLPSDKRAKLKSNEVFNAVRPNENSTLAFKNVLWCCANIIAIGTDLNRGELSQEKVPVERGNCSAKFESSRNCESNRLFFLLWQRYIFLNLKTLM